MIMSEERLLELEKLYEPGKVEVDLKTRHVFELLEEVRRCWDQIVDERQKQEYRRRHGRS